MFFHLAHPWLVADVVARTVSDRHERRHRQADFGAVELHAIAADVSCLFESLDALHDGGPREADFISDRLVARAAILTENAQNPSVGGVELGLCGHLGGS